MTSDVSAVDPYRLRPEDVQDPPRGLLAALRKIGPGMVLAASIVGSGELIATTTLGAQAGFAALWVVFLSCLLKPVVQEELGRYTIATGETGLEGLNRVPGPRIAGPVPAAARRRAGPAARAPAHAPEDRPRHGAGGFDRRLG